MISTLRQQLDIHFYHRSMQVAIATVIAICIYKLFSFHYGYWIVISAIITIRANVGASIIRAKDRMLGTVLGVLVGISLAILFPQNNLILFVISPLLVFLTVYLMNVSYSYSIFFGSILLVLLLGHGSSAPWQYGFDRILDTLIGLSLGIAIVYFLWPSCSKQELYQQLNNSIKLSANYFDMIFAAYLQNELKQENTLEQIQQLQTTLRKSMFAFKEFSYEPSIMKVSAEAIFSIILSLNTIYDILITMTLAVRNNSKQTMSPAESQIATDFAEQIKVAFQSLHQLLINCPNSYQLQDSAKIILKLDQQLITEQRTRELLANCTKEGFGMILVVYELKKLAVELTYLERAVRQLLVENE